jgi:hypothetical protein
MTPDNDSCEIYEQELIESLAESFSIAIEFLDAETIIKCIKVALENDKKYYEENYNKYVFMLQKISSD